MKYTAKTLYEFWSGFTIPAYEENKVPDDAVLPYITYELKEPVWRSIASYSARVWYRDTSMLPITQKVDEISHAIGEGIMLRMTKSETVNEVTTVTTVGYMWLFKEDEFVQMQPIESDEDNVMCAYLSMTLHVLT